MSSVILECDACGKTLSVQRTAFTHRAIGQDEREMGTETTYEAAFETQCVCQNHITIKHLTFEYPEGSENHLELLVAGAKVVQNSLLS